MGTKGTCKTSIAEGLVSYLELYVEGEEIEDELTIDESDRKTIKRFSISSAPGTVGGGLEVSGCGLCKLVHGCYHEKLIVCCVFIVLSLLSFLLSRMH